MNDLLVSALFTDSGRYECGHVVPKQLELPVFILKRLSESRRRLVETKLKKYDQIYHFEPKTGERGPEKCGVPQGLLATQARREQKHPNWHLAPNRYTLKSPLMEAVTRQAGLKGPFRCFTVARTDATICGRNAPSKFTGSKKFIFDPPPGVGPLKSFSVRKLVFEKFPQPKVERCTEIRPEPTAYFQNIMAPRQFKGAGYQKPADCLNFHPSTSVPVTALSIHKVALNKPSPDRYEPDDNFEIPGKGHKSAFLTPLLAPKFVQRNPVKSDFTIETNKVDFGRGPRSKISVNPLCLRLRPITVRQNVIFDVEKRRRKRALQKNVAFLSGTTRFGVAPFKNRLTVKPKLVPRPKKWATCAPQAKYLLSKTTNIQPEPRRLIERTGFSFEPMPAAKLVVAPINTGTIRTKKREIYGRGVVVEEFFKDAGIGAGTAEDATDA